MQARKRLLITLITYLSASLVPAAQSYRQVDSLMRICPASTSVENIAGYIGKHCRSDAAKLRAAYSWVAQHISYDLASVKLNPTYKSENDLINKTLKTRKAVCSGYTKTMRAIAAKFGIEVLEISGYTRQNEKIDEISHAWCAVKIAGKWKIIDPTWSAGFVADGKYRKKFNDKWFLVEPEQIIRTHMPFDPVWQFSFFPVNHREFYGKKSADSITSRFFSYPDTIAIILKMSEKNRLLAANRRIAAMDGDNPSIERHIAANKRVIASIAGNEKVEQYNSAVDIYNQASTLYNSSIKNPQQSTHKLLEADEKLMEAAKILNQIEQADKELLPSIKKLKESIKTLRSNIKKYCNGQEKYRN
jgi:hypothetical protein